MGRLLLRALLAALPALALSGCASETLSYRLAPPTIASTSVTAGTLEPLAATGPDLPGGKEGRASSQSFLGLVSTGNAGAAQAARSGGIERIRTADVEVVRVRALFIPVFTRYTVIVRGE